MWSMVKRGWLKSLLTLCVCMMLVLCGGIIAKAEEQTFSVTPKERFTITNNVITAFAGDKDATQEVVIPKGVTAIGDNVFKDYMNLKTVVLPDSVVSFGKNTFCNSGISTMAVYSDITDSSLVTVENYAVNVITLPSALKSIDATTFSQAKSICEFAISEQNKAFKTGSVNTEKNGSGELLLSKDGKKLYRMAPDYKVNDVYAIPDGIVEILPYSIESNMGANRQFVIPVSVTTIGDYAFYGGNNLNRIDFVTGSKLTTIGAFAFAKNQNLCSGGTPFTLPESVTSIGESCFKDCINMQVDISKTKIVSIPQFLFNGCRNIHTVTLPETVKYIEAYAFYGNDNLNEIIFLGKSLEKIGTGAFQGCNNLHGIEIPEGVQTIENDTFDGCWNLNKIVLPESVKTIGDNAFKDCKNIHEMVIPANVNYISNSSFAGAKQDEIDTSKNEYAQASIGGLPKKGETFVINGIKYKVTKSAGKNGTVAVSGVKSKKLKKAVIPSTVQKGGYTLNVTEISKNAFKKCTKLTSVTIGKNVRKIGSNAFYGDKKLKRITIKSTKLKSVGKNAVKNIHKKAVIKVPKKQLKKYKKLFKSKTGYRKSMKIKK